MTTVRERNPRGTGRNLIIAAAIDLIAERGLGAVRLRHVAERAGVSLGSTTYHFADRDELLAAAIDEHTSALLDAVAVTGADEAGAAVREVFADRRTALVCAEIRLHATRDPQAAELADEVHRTLAVAVDTARGRRRAAPAGDSVVATLNTLAVDTARAHTDPVTYAAAMRDRVDDAIAS
ncbi:MAG: TetR family transcriptional regulator [Gordonia polyisoprenivorans]|nr:TetR family transcriptional regulator [Gordonia polyisoprenivorans]